MPTERPSPERPIARRPEALFRNVGTEVLVILGGDADVRWLAGPAARVWEVLEPPATPAGIADKLRPAAPPTVDLDALVADVLATLTAAGSTEPVR